MARGTNNHANGHQMMFGSRKANKMPETIPDIHAQAEIGIEKGDHRFYAQMIADRIPGVEDLCWNFAGAKVKQIQSIVRFNEESEEATLIKALAITKLNTLAKSTANTKDQEQLVLQGLDAITLLDVWPSSERMIGLSHRIVEALQQGDLESPRIAFELALKTFLKNRGSFDLDGKLSYLQNNLSYILSDVGDSDGWFDDDTFSWKQQDPEHVWFDYVASRNVLKQTKIGSKARIPLFSSMQTDDAKKLLDELDEQDFLKTSSVKLNQQSRQSFLDIAAESLAGDASLIVFEWLSKEQRKVVRFPRNPLADLSKFENGKVVFTTQGLSRAFSKALPLLETAEDPDKLLGDLIVSEWQAE